MKKYLILIFVFTSSFAAWSQDTTIVRKDLGFSITFPGSPIYTINPGGEFNEEVHTYLYKTSLSEYDSNLAYSVINFVIIDTMNILKQAEVIDSALHEGARKAAKGLNGQIIEENRITIDSFPGNETKIDFRNGFAIIHSKMFLVESKMYLLQVIYPTENKGNRDIDKFFNSFRLLP
ncbi:MAG: hypothetical protein H6607_11490 [Flavobacteriales bacterium]|nr:hypothetical protein [Flavobacteriales bacterium]